MKTPALLIAAGLIGIAVGLAAKLTGCGDSITASIGLLLLVIGGFVGFVKLLEHRRPN